MTDAVRPPGGVADELRTIGRLAWPVVIGQLGLFAMGMTDMVMVGRLGADALGALGVANMWAFGTLLLGVGTAMGIDPPVAQAYGGGRPADAGAALVRGAVVTAGVGVAIVAAYWYAAPLLTLLQQPASLIPDAALYCRILAPSVPLLLAFELLRRFLQGSGRMQPAMWAIVVGNLVNVFADWVLIYGKLGAPAMGVAGAAWATAMVRVATLTTLLVIAWPELRRARPPLAGLFAPAAILRMAGITLPVGVQLGTEVWAFTACGLMAGWLGPIEVAAHTAALNLASLAFMIPLGLSAAASTRVGNLVGAGHPWGGAGKTAIGMAAAVMALSATTFAVFPHLLGRIYLDGGPALALTAAVLPLAGLFQLADGTQVACFGVLRGLGDTTRPMAANLVGYWLIGIPLGWWLAFRADMGLRGIWMGLALSLIIVAALLLARVAWHLRQPAPDPVASG